MLRTHARVTRASGDPSHLATSGAVLEALPRDVAELDVRGGRVAIDRATGALVRATAADGTEFMAGTAGRGLVRIAAPLPDYPSHFVELGLHGAPSITETNGKLTLVHERLKTKHADLPIRVEVDIESWPEGW
jgi:hypothetical protein